MLRAAAFFLLAAAGTAQVHRVPSAEQWFPSDPKALQELLDRSFTVAGQRAGSVPPRRGLLALIAPHAGLAYSGAAAAAAYSRLAGAKTIILLGFSHRYPVEGVVAPALDAYATPLGEIRVNRDALKQLGFPREAQARVGDHSFDNHLPFLKRAAPEATIVPLCVGALDAAQLDIAARKLATRLKQGDILVASSDFTHYGRDYSHTPFPHDGMTAARLRQRFGAALESIGTLAPARFEQYLRETGDTICGVGPIRLLMAALAQWKEEVYLTPLDYFTSGDLTKDYSSSVSYGALAFYPASSYALGLAAQARLLSSARRTLDQYVKTGAKTRVPVPEAERDVELQQHSGVFVTIKKAGELRGCLGDFHGRHPLWEGIAERTIAAASEDPRFPAVTAWDGPLSLEISLLTPFRRLAGWKDFRLGQGVVLELDGRSSTFLPQVAAETGWSRDKFLEELAKKAGLPPQAYRDPKARLYVYIAHVYREAGPPAVANGDGAAGRR